MPELIKERKVRKTRNAHKCFGCRETIPAGSEALASTNTDEGEIYTLYFCKTCADWLRTECAGCMKCDPWGDGIFEGDILGCRQHGKFD